MKMSDLRRQPALGIWHVASGQAPGAKRQKPDHRESARSRRAFSLTELMVVVALICLLASLIISLSGRAYVSAQMVACQHNLSQIGQAAMTYKIQNRMELIWNSDNGEPEGRWYHQLKPFLDEIVLACPAVAGSDATAQSNAELAGWDVDKGNSQAGLPILARLWADQHDVWSENPSLGGEQHEWAENAWMLDHLEDLDDFWCSFASGSAGLDPLYSTTKNDLTEDLLSRHSELWIYGGQPDIPGGMPSDAFDQNLTAIKNFQEIYGGGVRLAPGNTAFINKICTQNGFPLKIVSGDWWNETTASGHHLVVVFGNIDDYPSGEGGNHPYSVWSDMFIFGRMSQRSYFPNVWLNGDYPGHAWPFEWHRPYNNSCVRAAALADNDYAILYRGCDRSKTEEYDTYRVTYKRGYSKRGYESQMHLWSGVQPGPTTAVQVSGSGQYASLALVWAPYSWSGGIARFVKPTDPDWSQHWNDNGYELPLRAATAAERAAISLPGNTTAAEGFQPYSPGNAFTHTEWQPWFIPQADLDAWVTYVRQHPQLPLTPATAAYPSVNTTPPGGYTRYSSTYLNPYIRPADVTARALVGLFDPPKDRGGRVAVENEGSRYEGNYQLWYYEDTNEYKRYGGVFSYYGSQAQYQDSTQLARNLAEWLAGGTGTGAKEDRPETRLTACSYGYNVLVGDVPRYQDGPDKGQPLAGFENVARGRGPDPVDSAGTIRVLDYSWYDARQHTTGTDDDPGQVQLRHGGKANVLFMDGHVEPLDAATIMSTTRDLWKVTQK